MSRRPTTVYHPVVQLNEDGKLVAKIVTGKVVRVEPLVYICEPIPPSSRLGGGRFMMNRNEAFTRKDLAEKVFDLKLAMLEHDLLGVLLEIQKKHKKGKPLNNVYKMFFKELEKLAK